VDYHLITHNGVYLIHSDTMTTRKSLTQAEADRRTMMLSGKPLVPDGFCHYCGWLVPRLAHWCCSECATLFSNEKSALVP
jgi:hypothetical protein